MASTTKKSFTSSTEVLPSMMNPGTEAPIVKESREARMPKKVTAEAFYELNQLIATLLGVFRTNKLPIAAKRDPKRQRYGYPTFRNILSQQPAMTNTAPIMKAGRMPYLLSSQLQGNAKMGCAIVKSKALRVTKVALI